MLSGKRRAHGGEEGAPVTVWREAFTLGYTSSHGPPGSIGEAERATAKDEPERAVSKRATPPSRAMAGRLGTHPVELAYPLPGSVHVLAS